MHDATSNCWASAGNACLQNHLRKQRDGAEVAACGGKQQRCVAAVTACIGVDARRRQQQPQHRGMAFQRCICKTDGAGG
jgi:hypothetical protein